MSKTLGKVAIVAGAVAAIATGVGALGVLAAQTAATVSTIAQIATAVSTVASVGAQLTAKPPAAQGSVTNMLISPTAPAPIMFGRTYYGGVVRHDVGYGGKVSDVHNPYRFMATVYSVAGPIGGIEKCTVAFDEVVGSGTGLSGATGYYSGFLWADRQLGARPESDALAPQFSGAPNWGAAYKLSGKAAVGWSLKFDKKGRRFAGGVPPMGIVGTGVRCYDPRLDSTYTGGSGSCRVDDRATFVYTANPAICALQYALGWTKDGMKEAGLVIPLDGIDVASFVAFANVCDTNGWTVSGVRFETGSFSENWNNLKALMAAGGGVPIFSGGKLTAYYQASRLVLDTITDDDLADGEVKFTPWPAWQDGRNGIIPKYRSEAHQWEMVQSDLVSDATLLANDGEAKVEEIVFDMVADKDQAAQLSRYLLWERRERGPIDVPVKARLRHYRPGDRLTLSIEASTGIPEMPVLIIRRSFDPVQMRWNLTLREDRSDKHAAALGETGTAPETVTLPTPEDLDAAGGASFGYDSAISAAITQSLITASDGAMTSAVDGSTATITVPNSTRTYPAPYGSVSVTGDDITGLDFNQPYLVYYDDDTLEGGAVTYGAAYSIADAVVSETNPYRHFVGSIVTVKADGSPGDAPALPPPGTGGGGLLETYEEEPGV